LDGLRPLVCRALRLQVHAQPDRELDPDRAAGSAEDAISQTRGGLHRHCGRMRLGRVCKPCFGLYIGCTRVLLRPHMQVSPLFIRFFRSYISLTKPPDTVGHPSNAEICVSHMSSWKAKKLRKPSQEKVLLELCSRMTNSIPPFCETERPPRFFF